MTQLRSNIKCMQRRQLANNSGRTKKIEKRSKFFTVSSGSFSAGLLSLPATEILAINMEK